MDCAAFDVVAGPGDLLPADDGSSTWLRLFDFTGANLFENATDGAFGPPTLLVGRGTQDVDGIAPVSLLQAVHIGANFVDAAQQLGQTGTICLKIEQDPVNTGWIDCDGGTNPDADMTVDSMLGSPPPPNPVPNLTIPGNADPGAAAGSAQLRVRIQLAVEGANNADCSATDYSASPVIESVLSTGSATSTVLNDWIDGQGPQSAGVNTTSLGGVVFSCADWAMRADPMRVQWDLYSLSTSWLQFSTSPST